MYLSLRQDRKMNRLMQAPLGLMYLRQVQREANTSPTRADAISGRAKERLTQAPQGLIYLGQGQREANASPTRADAIWGRAKGG